MLLLETSPLDMTAVGALFLISMGLVKILELVIKNRLDPNKTDPVKPNGNGKKDKDTDKIMLPKECNECFTRILKEITDVRKDVEKLNQFDTIQKGIITDVKELKADVNLIKSTLLKKE